MHKRYVVIDPFSAFDNIFIDQYDAERWVERRAPWAYVKELTCGGPKPQLPHTYRRTVH